MTINLSAETQRLLEEQMRRHGQVTPEDIVRVALEKLDQEEGDCFEDLDTETQAGIEEGLNQADRGEGKAWEEVKEELRSRFLKK
jgi:predicted transcriptional regulator